MVTEWKLQVNLAVCMSGSHWNGTKRDGTTKNWKYFQKSTETCLYLYGQKCAQRSPWSVTKVGIMEGPSSHVQMCELDCKEGWVLKKWCFWTIGLEKTLERPLDSKEIKSVNRKEINPEYSLEGLMLKLKPQYFGHLMQRTDSLEKTLMLGKIEGRRRWGWQRLRWFDGIIDAMDMSLRKLQEIVKDKKVWHAAIHGLQRVGHNWTTRIMKDVSVGGRHRLFLSNF